MTVHFNLVVLSDNTDENNAFNTQQPEATVNDATLSTSTANEKTYIKVPSRLNSANRDTKRIQPTRAVSPICRRDYGLINGIPAGYESDDSWDQNSITHEPETTRNHTHNIVSSARTMYMDKPPK